MFQYQAVPRPFAETYQNNRWNPSRGTGPFDNVGLRRSAPVEPPYRVQRNGVWFQGNRVLPGFRAPMYLARPRDGKRTGFFGRLKDGLSNEGPDVFVMKCGDSRTFMKDRPQRWQWSGWQLSANDMLDRSLYDKDFRAKDIWQTQEWLLGNAMSRAHRDKYNFRTRRFESGFERARRPPERCWRDADWEDGAKRRHRLPLSYRDGYGQWYSRVPPDSGDFAGGRARNP